ncbi:MAG: glycerophosphodiester phosphodiesterase family protein [Bacteroidales bacterium]
MMKKKLAFFLMILGIFFFLSCENSPKTQIIAHRGYWNTTGSAQNSIKALEKADSINVYGSEFDINLTSDSVLIVCHGPSQGSIKNVQQVPYSEIAKLQLSNGEAVPTLEDYLNAEEKLKKVRLILEIKSHPTVETENYVVAKAIDMIKDHNLLEKTSFISFSLNVCKEIHKILPNADIQYLGGKFSPSELNEIGITGLDYYIGEFRKHPEWIEEAHELGLTTNAWTVSSREDLLFCINNNINFVTTNDPLLAQELIKK